MKSIRNKIETAAGTMDNLAHIVAMHKQDIFSLLKNNMGE
jgi:hypothetical protein